MFFFEQYDWATLSQKAGYSSARLAKLCNVSLRHLEREFRCNVGCSPKEWLDARRMLLAKGMLLQGKSVKLVASELGYNHPTHFSRNFRRCCQISPTEFLRRSWSCSGGETEKCREKV